MSESRPEGRPTLYDPRFCSIANNLGLLGCTDVEIADALEIAPSTLYLWKQQHAEFSESLNEGKLVADGKVARALYDAALNGNVTAGIFWLKNRRKVQWRDQVPEELGKPEDLATQLQETARAADAEADAVPA